jgi:hypothetical protein
MEREVSRQRKIERMPNGARLATPRSSSYVQLCWIKEDLHRQDTQGDVPRAVRKNTGDSTVEYYLAMVNSFDALLPEQEVWEQEVSECRGNASSCIAQEEALLEAMRDSFASLMDLDDALRKILEESEENSSGIGAASIAVRAQRTGKLAEKLATEGKARDSVLMLRAIGEQAKDLRKKKGLSRELLSGLSSVSRDDIFCFEHGLLDLTAAYQVARKVAPHLQSPTSLLPRF